jgi:Na+/melibiose symporter-like transporter
VPPLTGIMINSVPSNQKTSANSISNLLQNLLGYLPAPGLYGFIASITGGSTSRWPMGMLMFSTIITIFMLWIGINKKIANDLHEESHADSINHTKGGAP